MAKFQREKLVHVNGPSPTTAPHERQMRKTYKKLMSKMQNVYRFMDILWHTITIDENQTPSTISIDQATLVPNQIQLKDAKNVNQINLSLNDAPSTTPSLDHFRQKLQKLQNMQSIGQQPVNRYQVAHNTQFERMVTHPMTTRSNDLTIYQVTFITIYCKRRRARSNYSVKYSGQHAIKDLYKRRSTTETRFDKKVPFRS